MTRKEEKLIFEMLSQIRYEVHRNSLMLQGICDVVNAYLASHHQENEADFGRNILANLLANGIDVTRFFKK